ncbi:hypothetical protein, conserved [Eimeria praecox]|uniref:Uncharacterized protein n=1 Tax=Eimeria praecox TaxID=51316 RepID=U6GZN1_9EIME|nr:hypothetical protein, conserved [Eimeria praecox]
MLTAKLCKACEDGDVKEVEELLASGATPNFAPSGNGYRYPLHYAATSGHTEIVKLLLKVSALRPQKLIRYSLGTCSASLKSANSQKHTDVMMLLLDGGADVEATDAKIPSLDVLGPGFGYLTPLHYATEAGHVDTVELLLQLGADPRGVDASGWTPVHWACRRGHKPVVDLLLSYGGSIEDRDFRSLTPLDVAYLFNHTALAKLLDANKSSEVDDGVPQEEPGIPPTSIVEQNCSAFNSIEWQREEYLGWRGGALARLALGASILVISVGDYLSRVFMAAFFAVAARTFQGLGPTLAAATVLACCSVVLPTVALGICCSCHFRSIGIWAAWRAAKFVHAMVDSESGEGQRTLQPTRLALDDLLCVNLLRRLFIGIIYSDHHYALKFAAAGCILPPAAVVCCLLLVLQIVVVTAAALLAILCLGALSFVWISAFKAFLLSRRGLLLYLDCLTHASALGMSTEGSVQQGNEIHNPRAHELPPNRAPEMQPVSEHRLDAFRENTGHVYPFGSLYPSKFVQSPGSAGKAGTDAKPDSIYSLAGEKLNLKAVEDKENQARPPRDATSGGPGLSFRWSAYYTKASHCGNVPQKLHPCPSLQWAIQLHRQHIEIYRDRQRLMQQRRKRCIQQPGRARSCSSCASGTVPAREQRSAEQMQKIPGKAGWSLHMSTDGRFDDSLRAQVYAQDRDTLSAVCGEAKEMFWPGAREQGSTKSSSTDDKSQGTLNSLDNDATTPWCHDILAFAYGGHAQETHIELAAAADSHSVAPCTGILFSKEVPAPRGHEKVSLRSDSAAYRLAGVSPYRWVQQKVERHHGAPPRSPFPITRSFRSRAAPGSPPCISNSRIPSKESFGCGFNSRRPKGTLRTAALQTKAVCVGSSVFSTAAHPALYTDPAECVEGPNEHRHRNPEVLCGFPVLRGGKKISLKSHIDDAEYDVMVTRTERLIFSWFERLVSLRYAEVTALSQSAAEKVSSTISETDSWPAGGDGREILPPVLTASPSVEEANAGIKWDTFSTLFHQGHSTEQVDGVKGASAASTLEEEKRVPCLCTEDLFDLPVKQPVKSDARQYICGKRDHEQRDSALLRVITGRLCLDSPAPFQWSKHAGPGTSRGSCSTRGDSGSCKLAAPTPHYRFKDMVELPHLREERTPHQAIAEPRPSTSQACNWDDAKTTLNHSYSGREALWIVPHHISEGQADCSLQVPAAQAAEVGRPDDCIASEQVHICSGPPEPPITPSGSVCLEALGTGRSTLSKNRRASGENSLHGPLRPGGTMLTHNNTVSGLLSIAGVIFIHFYILCTSAPFLVEPGIDLHGDLVLCCPPVQPGVPCFLSIET